MGIEKGAEPYLLSAGKRGVLLIHTFTGSPAEMKLLADYLHENNFTVLSVRLPGHGTKVEDLNCVRHQEWTSAVEDAYHILRELCYEVNVVGINYKLDDYYGNNYINSFFVCKASLLN